MHGRQGEKGHGYFDLTHQASSTDDGVGRLRDRFGKPDKREFSRCQEHQEIGLAKLH
jgi:hypothetical protein